MSDNAKSAEHIASIIDSHLSGGSTIGDAKLSALSLQLAQVQATLAQVETLRSIELDLKELVAATRQAATR